MYFSYFNRIILVHGKKIIELAGHCIKICTKKW